MPQSTEITKVETRKPKQRRSQERFSQILEATAHLIELGGSRSLKIHDIAKEAGVSVGSIYQYFENIEKIIESLANKYLEESKQILSIIEEEEFKTLSDLDSVIDKAWDEYYRYNQQNLAMQDIFIGALSTKYLQQLDDNDSQQNAAYVFEKIKHLFPKQNWKELRTTLYLSAYYVRETMRLALKQTPDDAKVTLKLGKKTVTLLLENLAKPED